MAKRRMRFGTWCAKDPDDETLICYEFHMKDADGFQYTKYFTSEDEQDHSMLYRLRYAWINTIEKRTTDSGQEVWYAKLYEE